MANDCDTSLCHCHKSGVNNFLWLKNKNLKEKNLT